MQHRSVYFCLHIDLFVEDIKCLMFIITTFQVSSWEMTSLHRINNHRDVSLVKKIQVIED